MTDDEKLKKSRTLQDGETVRRSLYLMDGSGAGMNAYDAYCAALSDAWQTPPVVEKGGGGVPCAEPVLTRDQSYEAYVEHLSSAWQIAP